MISSSQKKDYRLARIRRSVAITLIAIEEADYALAMVHSMLAVHLLVEFVSIEKVQSLIRSMTRTEEEL